MAWVKIIFTNAAPRCPLNVGETVYCIPPSFGSQKSTTWRSFGVHWQINHANGMESLDFHLVIRFQFGNTFIGSTTTNVSKMDFHFIFWFCKRRPTEQHLLVAPNVFGHLQLTPPLVGCSYFNKAPRAEVGLLTLSDPCPLHAWIAWYNFTTRHLQNAGLYTS